MPPPPLKIAAERLQILCVDKKLIGIRGRAIDLALNSRKPLTISSDLRLQEFMRSGQS